MNEPTERVPRRTAAQKKGQYATYAILLVVFGSCIWGGYFGLFHIDKTIYTDTDVVEHPLMAEFVDRYGVSSIRYTRDIRVRINRRVFVAHVPYSAEEFRERALSLSAEQHLTDTPSEIEWIVSALVDAPEWEKTGLGWKDGDKGTIGFTPYYPLSANDAQLHVAYVPGENGTGRLVGYIWVSADIAE